MNSTATTKARACCVHMLAVRQICCAYARSGVCINSKTEKSLPHFSALRALQGALELPVQAIDQDAPVSHLEHLPRLRRDEFVGPPTLPILTRRDKRTKTSCQSQCPSRRTHQITGHITRMTLLDGSLRHLHKQVPTGLTDPQEPNALYTCLNRLIYLSARLLHPPNPSSFAL